MKITNDELMDYVDGTLDASRLAAVEAHLAENKDDAQLIADMKMAMGVLHDMNEVEPVTVSADFWPRLREKLPAQPTHNPLRSAATRIGAWLWPAQSPLRLSARVAAIALIMAMAAALFSPKDATRPTLAKPVLTAADKSFIQQSLNRHSAYVSSQPVASLPPGDGSNPDGDGEDDGAGTGYEPQ